MLSAVNISMTGGENPAKGEEVKEKSRTELKFETRRSEIKVSRTAEPPRGTVMDRNKHGGESLKEGWAFDGVSSGVFMTRQRQQT